jgi:hypothetical protein
MILAFCRVSRERAGGGSNSGHRSGAEPAFTEGGPAPSLAGLTVNFTFLRHRTRRGVTSLPDIYERVRVSGDKRCPIIPSQICPQPMLGPC